MISSTFTSFLIHSGHFLLLTSAISFAISLLIILTHKWHERFSSDLTGKIQAAHTSPTPRIGGLGIYCSLCIAYFIIPQQDTKEILGVIIVAGIPAWLVGFIEDVSGRTGVLIRLIATICSGLAACYLSGITLTRLHLPLIDELLQWWPIALCFTAFAVGGIANSLNIIDGYHGLSSGISLLAFLTFGLISYSHNDTALFTICLLAVSGIGGFFLFNYPWGKIFLGDGGAYFIGFALAWTAILLPTRNPEVSPWVSLAICAYPFIEVVYSMLRRKLQNRQVGDPDNQHMHSLLARNFIMIKFRHLPPNTQNALVAPLMWLFALIFIIPAIVFKNSTGMLTLTVAAAFTAYHLIYRRLSSQSINPNQ